MSDAVHQCPRKTVGTICAECGRETVGNYKRRYCSDACKMKAYRRRRGQNERPQARAKVNLSPKYSIAPRDLEKPGWVYFLISDDGRFCKIGMTRASPAARLAGLGTMLPFDVRIEHAVKTSRPRWLELALHTAFNDKHIRGEWFTLDANDWEYIKGLTDDQI